VKREELKGPNGLGMLSHLKFSSVTFFCLLRSTASHAELRPWFCPIVSSHSELASATLLCPAGFATVSEKARHIFVHLCNAVHHPSWIAADQCVKL